MDVNLNLYNSEMVKSILAKTQLKEVPAIVCKTTANIDADQCRGKDLVRKIAWFKNNLFLSDNMEKEKTKDSDLVSQLPSLKK